MATFDQVTIQTDHHVDVASQTDPSQPAAGSVDNGVEVTRTQFGVSAWGVSGMGVLGSAVVGGESFAVTGAGVVAAGNPVGVVGNGVAIGTDPAKSPPADGV